jgi:putative ABC transport system permease protein
VAGELFEVVGVARSPFQGMDPLYPVALWIPLSTGLPDAILPRARETLASRQFPVVDVWGRLRAGTRLAQASSEVAVIGSRLDEVFPRVAGTPRQWSVRRNAPGEAGGARTKNVPNIVLALGVVVILIATVNVANLSLARGTARVRERTIRSALGASRARLLREQLIESGLLIPGGGALSLGVLIAVLRSLSAELPLSADMSLDFKPEISPTVLAAAFGCMAVAFLVSGLWPAIQSSRRDTRDNLESGGFATPPKWRLHRNIVAWQVCGSAALFMLAAVCVKGVTSWSHDESVFTLDRIAIVQIDFQANGVSGTAAGDFLSRTLTALRALPGIESASASTGLPLRGMAPATVIASLDKSRSPAQASVIAVTPDFVATLGIRLVQGQGFVEGDDAAGRGVAIVSAGLARSLFDTQQVLDRSIALAGTGNRGSAETFTVVGVSADVGRSDHTRGMPLAFVPLKGVPEGRVTIVARASNADAALGTLRSTMRQIDADLALGLSGTGRAIAGRQSLVLRRSAQLAALLGTLALLLAMAGLYGVLSHVVSLRTREFGIRLALGATPRQVFAMILADGLRPVAKGLLLGIVVGLMVPIAARAFVSTDLAPFEPLALALVPLPFVVCALAACYVPAARASKVDPSVSLRHL